MNLSESCLKKFLGIWCAPGLTAACTPSRGCGRIRAPSRATCFRLCRGAERILRDLHEAERLARGEDDRDTLQTAGLQPSIGPLLLLAVAGDSQTGPSPGVFCLCRCVALCGHRGPAAKARRPLRYIDESTNFRNSV